MLFGERTFEQKIEIVNSVPELSEEEKKEIIHEMRFNSWFNCYTKVIKEVNENEMLPDGIYKANELTWEMISKGRGWRKRIYNDGDVIESLARDFRLCYESYDCSSWCGNKWFFDKMIEWVQERYGEDCPLELKDNELTNAHSEFYELYLGKAETIERCHME